MSGAISFLINLAVRAAAFAVTFLVLGALIVSALIALITRGTP